MALCPIGDVAPSIGANKFIDTYLNAKELGVIGNKEAEHKLVDSLGLYVNTKLLLELERTFAQYLKQRQQIKQAHGRKRT